MPTADPVSQVRALRRIRALSWPLTLLISIAFGLSVVVVPLVFVGLVGLPRLGALHNFVTFSGLGVGIVFGEIGLRRFPGFVLVDGLTLEQRLVIAGLGAACWGCNALALLQLRGLFSLYSRGIVFSSDNISRIKRFGLWVALTAVVVNVAGRVFVQTVHAPPQSTSNAALAVVIGAMICVIGYVMELAREADLERKEFV